MPLGVEIHASSGVFRRLQRRWVCPRIEHIEAKVRFNEGVVLGVTADECELDAVHLTDVSERPVQVRSANVNQCHITPIVRPPVKERDDLPLWRASRARSELTQRLMQYELDAVV